tara:strand:+ start:512 stop:847 length:336 start_codon:yes stop_codon:yes gene_type:complete
MHGTLNSPPASTPKCSKKWNYRKSGLTKHKKSKKERRVINKELRALKSEVVEIGSEKSEKHLETLNRTNINQPIKRNGSAKTMRSRHPKRLTKKVPSGHSGWKTIHQTKLH